MDLDWSTTRFNERQRAGGTGVASLASFMTINGLLGHSDSIILVVLDGSDRLMDAPYPESTICCLRERFASTRCKPRV